MNMGFKDVFKDSVNWSSEELVALYKILVIQSAVDGELSKDEAEVTALIMSQLKDMDVASMKALITRANGMSSEECLRVLKNMHVDKRTAAFGYLILVGAADGDFDDNEAAFSVLVAKVLGVA